MKESLIQRLKTVGEALGNVSVMGWSNIHNMEYARQILESLLNDIEKITFTESDAEKKEEKDKPKK